MSQPAYPKRGQTNWGQELKDYIDWGDAHATGPSGPEGPQGDPGHASGGGTIVTESSGLAPNPLDHEIDTIWIELSPESDSDGRRYAQLSVNFGDRWQAITLTERAT